MELRVKLVWFEYWVRRLVECRLKIVWNDRYEDELRLSRTQVEGNAWVK